MNIRMIERYYAKKRRNRALIFSLVVHAIVIILTAIWLLKPLIEEVEDSISVDFVPPPQRIHKPKKTVRSVEQSQTAATTSIQSPAAKRLPASVSTIPRITEKPKLEAPPLSTVAELAPSPESILAPTDVNSPTIERGSGESEDGRGYGKSGKGSGFGNATGTGSSGSGTGLGNLVQSSGTGQDAFSEGIPDLIGSYEDEIGDQLGSIIDEEDGIVRGHIRLTRLKHEMSDWWQDPTAIPSLIKWLHDHTPTVTADMKYAGGALPLTDDRIMDAPLVIMTGHDQAMSVSYQRLTDRNSQASGFSSEERAALRKYILDHNGMLFFDYCGDGGNEKSFANLVETELRTVFPEYPMKTLEVHHEIFQSYFKLKKTPVGGSAFWGTGYKGGNVQWRYLKGILVPGRLGKPRLAVVFCQLDYLCSMETAEIDSRAPLASRRSSDVYRFMTNMFIYQMRQRAANK